MAKGFGGSLVDIFDDDILAKAASSALISVWNQAYPSLNPGQVTIAEWHVIPAMEDAILGDAENFDAGTLEEEGYASHFDAFQALSDTIEQSAEAAEEARDAAQDALAVVEAVL